MDEINRGTLTQAQQNNIVYKNCSLGKIKGNAADGLPVINVTILTLFIMPLLEIVKLKQFSLNIWMFIMSSV